MIGKEDYFARATKAFNKLLDSGKPVAFEEALKHVETPESLDRRCFGWIPASMHRDGLIVPSGFRLSNNAKHNNGIKRLWIRNPLVDKKRAASESTDNPELSNRIVSDPRPPENSFNQGGLIDG